MSIVLGVRNKFYNKQNAEPQRWTSIEKPCIQLGAIFAAIASYAAYLFEDSQLKETMQMTNEALLELGQRGPYSSLVEAVPIQPYHLKVLVVVVFGVLIVIGLTRVSLWANERIEDMDQDIQTPSPQATSKHVERRKPEEYELAKMEFTRKQLEKLTASEEFKTHKLNKTKRAKAQQTYQRSHSVLDIKKSDICDDVFQEDDATSQAVYKNRALHDEVSNDDLSQSRPKQKREQQQFSLGLIRHQATKIEARASITSK